MREILKHLISNLTKMRKNSKNLLELLFVIFSLVIIGYFIYVINSPPPRQQSGLASLMPQLTSTGKPIITVSVDSQIFWRENGKCFTSIEGTAKNIGDTFSEIVAIECNPPIISFEEQMPVKEEIGRIDVGQKNHFKIDSDIVCGKEIKLNCIAECKNC